MLEIFKIYIFKHITCITKRDTLLGVHYISQLENLAKIRSMFKISTQVWYKTFMIFEIIPH